MDSHFSAGCWKKKEKKNPDPVQHLLFPIDTHTNCALGGAAAVGFCESGAKA